MNTYFKLLEKVYHQNITSRQLSFGIGHIFKALQLQNLMDILVEIYLKKNFH